jgi:hypothetical protein
VLTRDGFSFLLSNARTGRAFWFIQDNARVLNLAMKILTALATGCLFVLFARTSEARTTYHFGKEESIYKIQETDLHDADGKPLDLAYKITTSYFFAGLFVHDDGYVLQSRENRKSYYSLPAARIAEFQASGFLPKPLPRYSISFFDYLIGYSFWLVVVIAIWVTVWSSLRKPKAALAAGTNTSAPLAAPPPGGPPAAALPPPPPGAPSSRWSSEPSSFQNTLFWSGFLGWAAALGGTAAEKLWVLTGCTIFLALVELSLMWWGSWRRGIILARVITQFFLWAIFITALRH